MAPKATAFLTLLACAILLQASRHSCRAQEAEPPASSPGIPETKIAVIQKKLAEAGEATSSLRKRRAYKNLAHDGEALLEDFPAAPNRFRVLEIVFQARKRLIGLENSDRNREALFETCAKLAQAPDEQAKLRLEADLLLSEKSGAPEAKYKSPIEYLVATLKAGMHSNSR